MTPDDFLPPRPPRANIWWGVASVVFHVAVVVLALVVTRNVTLEHRRTWLDLAALAGAKAETTQRIDITNWPTGPVSPAAARGGPQKPAARPARAAAAGGPGVVRLDTSRAAAAAQPAPTGLRAPAETVVVTPPAGVAAGGAGSGGSDTMPIPGTHRVLGPAFGDGRLWEEPLAAAGAERARRDSAGYNAAVHVERVDSAVAAKIQAFIDTMPYDSMAAPVPTSWTTNIDGKKFGVDGKWVYLGGIKLPTALLALLKLPMGNYQEAQREAHFMEVREEIIRAAERAQNLKDFKKYVKELRARNDSIHRAEHPPKPTKAKADSITT